MQTNNPIEINLDEFSHRASIYLLGVASTYHVAPEVALKAILETVSKRAMVPAPRRERITKEDVKAWLKTTDQSREWLADKCYVTKPTVNGWFRAAGKIPPAKLALIQMLMEDEQAGSQSTRKEVCHA